MVPPGYALLLSNIFCLKLQAQDGVSILIIPTEKNLGLVEQEAYQMSVSYKIFVTVMFIAKYRVLSCR